VAHLARCAAQDLHSTDTSAMNNTVVAFSQSLSFLSADLT